jgi:hypothetical protein
LAEELLEDAKGWALGDRNFWSPDLAERLGDEGLRLLATYKFKKKGTLATLVDAKEAQDRDGRPSSVLKPTSMPGRCGCLAPLCSPLRVPL